MNRALRIGAVAVAAGAAAAAAVPFTPTGPASAVGAPAIVVALPARADLSTNGKGVRFRLAVTCSNMDAVPITVQLTQTRSQTRISGSGTSGTSYTCNGHTQKVPVIVVANAGRFNAGGASATATATCGSTTCATDARNVELFRKA